MTTNYRSFAFRPGTGGIVAVTGHRPDKLGGYDPENPIRVWVRDQLKKKLTELRPKYCISGMALGVDQDFARCCIELEIPFLAAVPFIGQEKKWPPESQRVYKELLAKAFQVHVVSEGQYSSAKMQKRNEWMVDNCQTLIAVWDGSEGGTGNCVKYAGKIARVMVRIDPNDFNSIVK